MEMGYKRDGEEFANKVSKKVKTDASTEENFINIFAEPPSLQRIAIISNAIRMWSCIPLELILKTTYSYNMDRELKERFLNQLAQYFLPESLKTEVYNALLPVGHQLGDLLRVCRIHSLTLDSHLMDGSVYWTMEGTIDVVKSLLELFKKENPEKKYQELYELACKYCLEDYISKLWVKMPFHRKKKYNNMCKNSSFVNDLFVFWTFSVRGDLYRMRTKFERFNEIYDPHLNTNENMVSCSIFVGEFYALKYFWQKLSDQEKSDNIERWLNRIAEKMDPSYPGYISRKSHANMLHFLLSSLNDEVKQETFLRRHSFVVLSILLEFWQFQRFFLSTLSRMWDYLQEEVYISLMKEFLELVKIKRISNTDKLFRETWRISPSRLKTAYLEKLNENNKLTKVLLQLVEIGHTEMAVKLLNDSSPKLKKLLTSKMFCNSYFKTFFNAKKDPTLIEPLLEAISQPDGDLQSLKQEVALACVRDEAICCDWVYHGDFQAVDTFLKWGIQCEDEIENFKKSNFNPYKLCTHLLCPKLRLEKNIFDPDCKFLKELEKMYDHIDQVLCWYFNTDNEIREFKRTFANEKNFCLCLKVLCYMCRGFNAKEHLEKFKNFMFTSSEEINDFKKMSVKCIEHLVDTRRFDDAFQIFNWCLDSDKEINQFKIDVLLSDTGYKMLLTSPHYLYHDEVVCLIKWSFPLPKETISALKFSLNRNTLQQGGHWHWSKDHELKVKWRKTIFDYLDTLDKEYGK